MATGIRHPEVARGGTEDVCWTKGRIWLADQLRSPSFSERLQETKHGLTLSCLCPFPLPTQRLCPPRQSASDE